IAHGRHNTHTTVGDRNNVHNYVIDLVSGKLDAEDPDGILVEDVTFDFPIGTYAGKIYQCDDGYPGIDQADTWATPELSPSTGTWAAVHLRGGDGPDGGIYCMALPGGFGGSDRYHGQKGVTCEGECAIGPGTLCTRPSSSRPRSRDSRVAWPPSSC